MTKGLTSYPRSNLASDTAQAFVIDSTELKSNLLPKKVTLRQGDGTELKQVKVTIWKRPKNAVTSFIFDAIASLYGSLVGHRWQRCEQSDKSIVWVNKKSLSSAPFKALRRDVEASSLPVKERVLKIFITHKAQIKEFLNDQSRALEFKFSQERVKFKRKTTGAIHIKVEEQAGQGGFKTVFKVHNLLTNSIYAKSITNQPKRTSKQEKERATLQAQINQREVTVWQTLAAKIPSGIVKLHKVKSIDTHAIAPPKKITTWMEYCGGGSFKNLLEQKITTNDPHSQEQRKNVLMKIYSAAKTINEIHTCGYIHGDIKPDNIMLTEEQEPRVIDFGFTQEIGKPLLGTTPNYRAPEASGDQWRNLPASVKYDSWSLGIMLLTALAGKKVSTILAKSPVNMPAEELKTALDKLPWETYGPTELTDVVKKLLKIDPNERSSIGDILPELQAAIEAIKTPT